MPTAQNTRKRKRTPQVQQALMPGMQARHLLDGIKAQAAWDMGIGLQREPPAHPAAPQGGPQGPPSIRTAPGANPATLAQAQGTTIGPSWQPRLPGGQPFAPVTTEPEMPQFKADLMRIGATQAHPSRYDASGPAGQTFKTHAISPGDDRRDRITGYANQLRAAHEQLQAGNEAAYSKFHPGAMVGPGASKGALSGTPQMFADLPVELREGIHERVAGRRSRTTAPDDLRSMLLLAKRTGVTPQAFAHGRAAQAVGAGGGTPGQEALVLGPHSPFAMEMAAQAAGAGGLQDPATEIQGLVAALAALPDDAPRELRRNIEGQIQQVAAGEGGMDRSSGPSEEQWAEAEENSSGDKRGYLKRAFGYTNAQIDASAGRIRDRRAVEVRDPSKLHGKHRWLSYSFPGALGEMAGTAASWFKRPALAEPR